MAPMMAVTDRHFRALVRLLTRRTVLYTEMVVGQAAVHNPGLLDFSPEREGCVVAQLGGRDPASLGEAAAMCEARGYAGVNLNLGCPSERVSGKCSFGAALMLEPRTVTECLSAMRAAVSPGFPVTAKIRIGVDSHDSYEHLARFVSELRDCGVGHIIVHARKAILGLSTKANRSVPPLRYDFVHRLVRDFPDLEFTLNGGVKTLEEAVKQLDQGVHGVMIGRAAYSQGFGPLLFARADSAVYGCAEDPVSGEDTGARVLKLYAGYCQREVDESLQGGHPHPLESIKAVLKPLGFFCQSKKATARFRTVLDNQVREWKSELAEGKAPAELRPDMSALIERARQAARGNWPGMGQGDGAEAAGGGGGEGAPPPPPPDDAFAPCFPCAALARRSGRRAAARVHNKPG